MAKLIFCSTPNSKWSHRPQLLLLVHNPRSHSRCSLFLSTVLACADRNLRNYGGTRVISPITMVRAFESVDHGCHAGLWNRWMCRVPVRSCTLDSALSLSFFLQHSCITTFGLVVVCFLGTGGKSIYGTKFADENFQLKVRFLQKASAGTELDGSDVDAAWLVLLNLFPPTVFRFFSARGQGHFEYGQCRSWYQRQSILHLHRRHTVARWQTRWYVVA